jgi:membrane protein YdbS with pleckstrin-like domain
MEEKQAKKELPPFVKTWEQFYWLLAAWLVFLIAIFYAFTVYFA